MHQILAGKRVILGVCGGIAAYKVVGLASTLSQAGFKVDVILTEAATRFVTPLSFSAVTHRPAITNMWEPWEEEAGVEQIGHVRLAHTADLFIIAPATAQTLAKLALGLADNMLTATALSTRAPLLLAPAMETNMWLHPAIQQHAETLRARGATFIGPAEGHLASGASGPGRMVEPDAIYAAACKLLGRSGPLAGRRILITAGGTQEPLDPVRYIGNRSSGKMGVALARAALALGAKVTLVHAPLHVTIPFGVEAIPVRTAAEMAEATLSRLVKVDVLIGAAAVADYRPAGEAAQKMKKDAQETLALELVRTTDILGEVATRRNQFPNLQMVIGFAAETQDLIEYAQAKLQRKRLDLVVANDVSSPDAGFAVDTNRVTVITPDGTAEPWPLLSKEEVAQRLLLQIANYLGASTS